MFGTSTDFICNKKNGLSRILRKADLVIFSFTTLCTTVSMPRKISRDVKIAAVKLYERHLLDVDDILDCCNFSRRTWFRILKLWHETGDVVPETQSLSGRPMTVTVSTSGTTSGSIQVW